MSNFTCPTCGLTNIDCGKAGYKIAREIELEKKLEIAVKALKFYAEMENVECFGYCGDTNREHYLDIEAVIEDGHTAQQALKEIKE